MPVNLYYPRSECVCGGPIPDAAESGDDCGRCGRVLSESWALFDQPDTETTTCQPTKTTTTSTHH